MFFNINNDNKLKLLIMRLLRSFLSSIALIPMCYDYSYAKLQSRITTHPIATTILTHFSESYGRKSKKYIPPLIVESVGVDSLSAFCSKKTNAPDVFVAHRKLTAEDFSQCGAEGIPEFLELRLGFGAIVVLASSGANIKNISHQELYAAVTKFKFKDGNVFQNTSKTWNEIVIGGYQLPSNSIEIFAPAPNTDLKDVFKDRVLVHGCQSNAEIYALRKQKPKLYRDLCLGVRSDARLHELNLSAPGSSPEELLRNHKGCLVFAPAAALKQPEVSRKLISVDGVKPTIGSVKKGSYPLSAPIFLYVKISSLRSNKGLLNFLKYIYSRQNTDSLKLGAAGFIPLNSKEMVEQFHLVAEGKANFHLEEPSMLQRMIPIIKLPNNAPEPDMPMTFQGTPLDKERHYDEDIESGVPDYDSMTEPPIDSIDESLNAPGLPSWDESENYGAPESLMSHSDAPGNEFDTPAREDFGSTSEDLSSLPFHEPEETFQNESTTEDQVSSNDTELPEESFDSETSEGFVEDGPPAWHKLLGL